MKTPEGGRDWETTWPQASRETQASRTQPSPLWQRFAESEPEVLIMAIIANIPVFDYFMPSTIRYLSSHKNYTGKVLLLIPVYSREHTSSQRWRTTSKLHNWSQRNQALYSNSIYTCSHSYIINS